ncbi:helix-turn-helix domain-containing protein [Candidatus Micrarchaeota archaeon]|nr:helix-turn-helix domain-containing protein [Candidatus Micrarchaeota archaeon]MBU2476724.1 helix-turn-helix domain-containing protein [Candidatus Micrarchaeota archaeon]
MSYLFSLFEKYSELKVLRFLLSSGSGIHLNEISRRTKTSPSTVSKLLSGLQKDGLIEKQVIGTSHVFKVKSESPVIRQLKVFINVSLLTEFKVVEKILEVDELVHSIVLYGSFADGSNDAKSDFDLLVISDNKYRFNSVAQFLEKKTGVATSITAFSVLDWKKCRENNKAFHDSVKLNHIILFGSELF